MTVALLTAEDVRIRHEGNPRSTPNGLSLTVAAGEVVLVLGPSGCGKSTLALALNGLIPQSVPASLDGTITVAGLNSVSTPVARLSEQVAMVFQDPDAQLVTATVLDEVCFGPENLRLPAESVLHRAETALRRVGLWDRRDDNPELLSGGGKQRLAIACALALDAQLLVLDEPTANLDPAGIEEVYRVLGEILAAHPDRAVVLVEHNLDAAMDLVSRVVVLDSDGAPAFDGPAGPTLRDNADALLRLGVWLPVATLAGLRLRAAGVPLEPLPLTPAELSSALEAVAVLPEPGVDTAAVPAPAGPPESPAPPARATLTPAAGPAPLIRVRGLTVTREQRGRHGAVRTRVPKPVLHAIDLTVYAGDFLAVVGTNGAGKTTLVQAIAGVRAAARGTVRVGPLDPSTARAREIAGQVGFVFQNPEHQFLTATVFDELAHGLRVQRTDEASITAAIEPMLRRFGLDEAREQHPFLLSGGQKRRLSVASALITGARILVLDEPTFGQDRERAQELLGLLDELRSHGTTVIIVTHDLQLVADHASHVAVLHEGRLLAHDRTERVFADAALLERVGLRLPPLARAMRGLRRHPQWRGIVRLSDLPDGGTAKGRVR